MNSILDIIKTISKREWKHLAVATAIILFIISFVFFFAKTQTPEGYFYTGVSALNFGDMPVYYSYINQIKDGAILLHNNFSIEEPQKGTLNIVWLFAGLLARIFNLTEITTFFVLQILTVTLFMISLYLFISYIFSDQKKRITALYTTLFSAGIETYALPFILNNRLAEVNHWPITFWVPESNTFMGITVMPHFALSFGLIVFIYLLLLIALDAHKYSYALYAGLCGLILYNFHPYHAISMNAIFGVYLLYRLYGDRRRWFSYAVLFTLWFIPSVISVIYHFYLIKTDLMIGLRAAQNMTLTPPFLYVFLGYGFLFICAVYGGYRYFKHKDKNKAILFLIFWAVINTLIIYFPISFQRRFLTGFHIPLALLTVYSFNYLGSIPYYNRYIKTNQPLKITLFVLLFSLSLYIHMVRTIWVIYNHNPNFYLENEITQAIKWLDHENTKNYTVLSFVNTDYVLDPHFWITAFSNQKTYISHEHETIFYQKKLSTIEQLIKNNDQKKWGAFYDYYNIGYVFLPTKKDTTYYNTSNLEKIYSNDIYTIYMTNLLKRD